MLQLRDIKRERAVTREIHKLFLKAVRHDPKNAALTMLHAPYFFIFHVYVPLQVAYGLQAIVQKQFYLVHTYIVHLLISIIIGIIFFAIANFSFNRFGINGGTLIQKLAFANYLEKDYNFFANTYVGSLGLYAARLRQGVTDYDRLLFFDTVKISTIVFSSLIVLLLKSPPLAGITVLCVLVVLGSTIVTYSYRLRYRRLTSEADGEVAGVLGDALSHGTVVKSFAREVYENERLDESLSHWQKAQLKSWDLGVPTAGFRNLSLVISMAVLLAVSAHLYEQQRVTFAIIILVQLYVLKLVTAALDIADLIKEFDATMGSVYQPVATMMQPHFIKDPDDPIKLDVTQKHTLSFVHVSYRYDEQKSKQLALQNISIELKPGEKIGLVGYSGSGKTTLSKLPLRFMDPTGGSVRLGEHDIRDYKQGDLRSYMAYVPQEPLLFHRSILENIQYGNPYASEQEVLKAARAAYVHEFVEEMPQKYETLVGERGVKLSGGQRQRVAIARAILKDAPILVLDEATSALDSKSEKFIQEALWKLMTGRTALVIAHRLSTIQKMDRIIVLDKGLIVQQGTHDELKSQPGIYAELWEHQSGGYLGGVTEEE